MRSLLKFNRVYFIWAVILFCLEVLIALYLNDAIVRPYIGDFLVVILIYCFVKSFLDTPVLPTALAVLLFSYFVETLQYFHIINKLGFQDSPVARTVIGTSFEWIDIIAYTFGIAIVLFAERTVSKKITGIA